MVIYLAQYKQSRISNMIMKKNILKYASDLHLELEYTGLDHPKIAAIWKNNPLHNQSLALIGDIGNPFCDKFGEFIKRCSYNHDRVFFVPGNHEYWNLIGQPIRTVSETRHKMAQICDKYPNVNLLDNNSYQLNQVKIIGSTLWSHTSAKNRSKISEKIGNYSKIINENGLPITTHDTDNWNRDAVNYIKSQVIGLKRDYHYPCIVLTHYAPIYCEPTSKHYTSDPKYYGKWHYEAYHNNLKHLVKSPIVAWLYGHTHYCSTFSIDGVIVSANQLGHKIDPNFNPGAYIDLDQF